MSRRPVNLARRFGEGANIPFTTSHSKSRSSPFLPIALVLVGGLLFIAFSFSGGLNSASHVVERVEGDLSCTSEVLRAVPILKTAYAESMRKVLHVGPETCSVVSKLLKEEDTEAWGVEPYELEDADGYCKSLIRKGVVRVADIKFPLPYRPRSFNLVIVSDALDYLSPKYLNKTLPELARVADGLVIFAGYPGKQRAKGGEPKFGRLIKMIKDKETGDSKGYAFITFKTRDFAQKAIGEFQNKEFKGRKLRCSLSQTKHRLFMGNIPKGWTEKEFKAVIEENGPGVETIDLVKDPQNPSRNRGFAFIEYYNNACADYARQKMSDPQFKLESSTPTVSWADSKTTTADPSAAAQVKALYVKNLPSSATNEKLKELFERHGEVTKVVLPSAKAGQSKRDFGFIHYAERSSALKAVKETETYEIDGQVLDVALAKPLNEKKFEQVPQRAAPAYNPPQPAYGFVGDPYRTLSSVYGVPGGYQPPMIYGRGPMPAGMQMVPMVLPDGQIGYVLQQPEARAPSPPPRRHERRNDNRSGSRGHGSPSRNEGSRGRRYRPY